MVSSLCETTQNDAFYLPESGEYGVKGRKELKSVDPQGGSTFWLDGENKREVHCLLKLV